MKHFKYISFILTIILGLVSCQQKELFLCSPEGDIPVNVVIHWDSVPSDQLVLPRDMTVHWYPTTGRLLASDMRVNGGTEYLSADIFDVMCMDFNGNTNIAFRSNGTRPDFEAYNVRTSGTYNSLVPQLPGGEETVAEAYPYRFYIDSRSQDIDTENLPYGDTLTVHFYPKDVLREFTFMIYDVTGARYTAQNSGAISGMSASYYPATNKLATSPSTILFKRVEAIPNAQTDNRWTDAEKAIFAAKNPDWADSDTLKGWTRDWMVGKFVTFGPLDRKENRFRLTIESFSKSNNQYHGSWGYWHGQWENTVHSQIDSAMGKNGTIEEQLAWRKRNGGYDIVLYNDNRLIVPNVDNEGLTEGGFTVTVDDWGEMITVPTVGGKSEAKQFSAPMKAPINTIATIPDFVVNGIWKDGSEINCVFNAQQVYKPESGLLWEYSPRKYWYPSGAINFYAYAPAGIAGLNRGLQDNKTDEDTPPTIEYTMRYIDDSETPPSGTDEPESLPVVDQRQEDLLVAVQSLASPQTSAVPMHFQHAFSRVTVKARISDGDYNYEDENLVDRYRIKVTRVDLRNLYSKGKLQLNKDTGGSVSNGIPTSGSFQYGANVTLWNNTENLANYRFRLLSNTVKSDDDYTSLLNSNDGMFVIPQVTTGETTIYVEYNIYTYSLVHGEQYLSSETISFPVATGFAFEIGKQYVLQLELPINID
jgi:hypothetical protein